MKLKWSNLKGTILHLFEPNQTRFENLECFELSNMRIKCDLIFNSRLNTENFPRLGKEQTAIHL